MTPLQEMLLDPVYRAAVERRFWAKVDAPKDLDACWEWTGSKKHGADSYGHFKIKSHTVVASHRLAYALHYNVDPGEQYVCHRCDNPSCVNPNHLFLGSHKDNMRDMAQKGRARSGDQRGTKNGNAKLNEKQLCEIRDRISKGEPNTHIAADYGVTHQLISRIKRGRSHPTPTNGGDGG